MISKEALEEIKQVSEMYPDGIHKRQEIETFTRWQDPTIEEKDKEIERLESIINQVDKYVDKMSYSSIVDNPKKDLQKILKKENK